MTSESRENPGRVLRPRNSPYFQALHGTTIRTPKNVTEELYNTTEEQDLEQRRLSLTVAIGTSRARALRDPWDGYNAGRPGTAITQDYDTSVRVAEVLPEDNFSIGTTRLRDPKKFEGSDLTSYFSNSIMRQYARHSLVSHTQTQRLAKPNMRTRAQPAPNSHAKLKPHVLDVIERAAMLGSLPATTTNQSQDETWRRAAQQQSTTSTGRTAPITPPTTQAVPFVAPVAAYPAQDWTPYVPLSRPVFEAGSSPAAPESPSITSLPPATARAVVAESIARQTTAALAEDALRVAVLPPPPDLINPQLSRGVLNPSRVRQRNTFIGELDRLELGALVPARPGTSNSAGMSSSRPNTQGDHQVDNEDEVEGGLLGVMFHEHLRKAALTSTSATSESTLPHSLTQRYNAVQRQLWRNSGVVNRFRAVDLNTWQGDTKKSSDSVFSSPFFQ